MGSSHAESASRRRRDRNPPRVHGRRLRRLADPRHQGPSRSSASTDRGLFGPSLASYSRPTSRATVIRVSPWTAQRLGAIVGAGLAIVGVVWFRTRATPCPGAVTLEFHPPLADRGSYHIQLNWAGAKPCALTVT